jgi:hypothetical protein
MFSTFFPVLPEGPAKNPDGSTVIVLIYRSNTGASFVFSLWQTIRYFPSLIFFIFGAIFISSLV